MIAFTQDLAVHSAKSTVDHFRDTCEKHNMPWLVSCDERSKICKGLLEVLYQTGPWSTYVNRKGVTEATHVFDLQTRIKFPMVMFSLKIWPKASEDILNWDAERVKAWFRQYRFPVTGKILALNFDAKRLVQLYEDRTQRHLFTQEDGFKMKEPFFTNVFCKAIDSLLEVQRKSVLVKNVVYTLIHIKESNITGPKLTDSAARGLS